MKDVHCYELFGGIALKNHAFSYYLKHVANVILDVNVYVNRILMCNEITKNENNGNCFTNNMALPHYDKQQNNLFSTHRIRLIALRSRSNKENRTDTGHDNLTVP